MAIWSEARLATCLGIVVAKGVIPSIIVNMVEYGGADQVNIFKEVVFKISTQNSSTVIK